MPRDAKLRRLNDFRRKLPFATAAALAAILIAVQKEGAPEIHTRNAMREARDNEASSATPFGPMIQEKSLHLVNGGTKNIKFAEPFACLWTAVTTCRPFHDLLYGRLLEKPSSPEQPWTIIFYTDEVTPGNPLATDNKRRFHAIYWSFMELGVNALSREEAWFSILAEYSVFVKEISAGLSQVVAAALKSFFDPAGFNFQLGGINLPFAGADVRLWAKLGVILQDGGAHKSVFHSRGDGAAKPCLLCKNLFTDWSNLCGDDGERLLRSNIIKFNELVPATSRELRTTARYVATQSHRADFADVQQALGITHHPHSLLLDRALDVIVQPAEAYVHDWMHALFVDGVVNMVVYLLFEAFVQGGMQVYDGFATYVEKWKWPRRLNNNQLADHFAAPRAKKHRQACRIKCQASDMLSCMGVLALFTQTVLLPLGICNNECAAFLALAEIVDFITAATRNNVQPETLLGSVHRFLELFVAAFGYEWLTPKCHWLLHFAKHLSRLGYLPDCFALERKHRIGKRYATEIKNTKKLDSTMLLKEITCQHLAMLRDPDVFNFTVGLIHGRRASKRVRKLICEALEFDELHHEIEVLMSLKARFNANGFCQTGDVILLRIHDNTIRAGRLELSFSVDGIALCIISVYTLHQNDPASGSATWAPSAEDKQVFELSQIFETLVYSVLPNGFVKTLMPIDCR